VSKAKFKISRKSGVTKPQHYLSGISGRTKPLTSVSDLVKFDIAVAGSPRFEHIQMQVKRDEKDISAEQGLQEKDPWF